MFQIVFNAYIDLKFALYFLKIEIIFLQDYDFIEQMYIISLLWEEEEKSLTQLKNSEIQESN